VTAVRPDRLVLGVHQPDGGIGAEQVRRALAPFGEVAVRDAAPLLVGTAGGVPAPAVPAGEPFGVLDGYLLPGDGRPRSEAELAAAVASRGAAAAAAARGAFAGVLWDPGRRRGILLGDQLAERALFFAVRGTAVLFATDLAPLVRLLPGTPEPDPVAVAHWLGSAGLRDGRTLFAGVRRLPGGSFVELADGASTAPRRYWTPRFEPPLDARPGELIEQLRSELEAAVARVTDGRHAPAVALSGGIDSPSVAALAARVGARPRAYSAVYPHHVSADEEPLVDLVVRRLELESVRGRVERAGVLHGNLAYLARWGVPDISMNTFVMVPLQRRVAEDDRDVLLDGDGGDELFSPALDLVADHLRAGRVPAALRTVGTFPGMARTRSPRRRAAALLEYGVVSALASRRSLSARLTRPTEPPAYLNARARGLLAGARVPDAWVRPGAPRWWSRLADTYATGPVAFAGTEHEARLARMSGVTERRPLRDVDLYAFVARLPPELSLHAGIVRPHLRRAVEGMLPDEVRLRVLKTSFNEVSAESLSGPDRGLVASLLGDPGARIREYADPDEVARLLVGPPEGFMERSVWAASIQRLTAVECWLRSLEDPGVVDGLLERAQEPRVVIDRPAPAGR
jgi:asparagine synthase (glutamine-hydrolysing)